METYFESILQLRKPDQRIIEFVEKKIMDAGKKGVSVSKIKKVRNGFDYYLSSNSFAVGLGRQLEKTFGGFLKVSEQLFSRDRQTSKDLYRMNVFFEPLPVRVGDVLSLNDSLIRVSSIGKKIAGIDLESGKMRFVDFGKEHLKLVETEIVSVVRLYPRVEVIDPVTYQPIPLVSKRKFEIGEKIRVAVSNGRAFYVV